MSFGATRGRGRRPRRHQNVRLAAIRQLGGTVETDPKLPGRPVVKVSLAGTEFRDADLAVLQAFPELRELNLTGWCKEMQKNHLTDAGLKHLQALRAEVLDLDWHNVTDTGLPRLEGLSRLKRLNLNETPVTNKGIERLQRALPQAVIRGGWTGAGLRVWDDRDKGGVGRTSRCSGPATRRTALPVRRLSPREPAAERGRSAKEAAREFGA